MNNEQRLFPERVRATCCGLRCATECWVDPAALDSFLASLPVDEVLSFGSTLSSGSCHFDVRFGSAAEEAGFIALAHALDFGSGFRKELHEHCNGLGAWLTMKAGLERMHAASGGACTGAEWLAALDAPAVSRLFTLPSPALDPLTVLILRVAHELARGLRAAGIASMTDFVRGVLARGSDTPACDLVRALVETFPLAFNDVHEYEGQRVCFYKKAQLVVGELYYRFRKEDHRFDFPDAHRLTAFVDNVIVATLRKAGVVSCTEALSQRISRCEPLPSGSRDEVALRAAALAAVERVCTALASRDPRAPPPLLPMQLGNWLWGCLGKTPEYRKYERHHTKDTVFY
eukprot:TRINITY_DN4519_c0_g1_i2.p1 TRINITY_DN4519_c0_g1~~TRINITY_DN4519_c0_g1_i2.p1  ORF type:complete len:368 (+),score=108.39 TRINITY_DN4519_c0_g1_i2:72-1106(+)